MRIINQSQSIRSDIESDKEKAFAWEISLNNGLDGKHVAVIISELYTSSWSFAVSDVFQIDHTSHRIKKVMMKK